MIKVGNALLLEQKELTEIIETAVTLALEKREAATLKDYHFQRFLSIELTTPQAAEYLSISTDHLNRLTSEGKLAYIPGKPNRYLGQVLMDYRKNKMQEADPGRLTCKKHLTELTCNRHNISR